MNIGACQGAAAVCSSDIGAYQTTIAAAVSAGGGMLRRIFDNDLI